MKDYSLIKTEKRLVAIFMIGAMSFLILFEAFFIGIRIIFENKFQKDNFLSQTQVINEWRTNVAKTKRWAMPPIGISSLSIDGSGNILGIRWNLDKDEVIEFIEKDVLAALPLDIVTEYHGTLMLRIQEPSTIGTVHTIFFKKSGYPIDDILRDAVRFLLINISLIIPFYFIGRYFVRRTLVPVAENIDTMSHFIHDAGHELKTPLAIISGNLQILRDSKKNDTEIIEESISTIYSMSDSLDGLVELANLKAPTTTARLWLKDNVSEILAIHHEAIQKKNIEVKLDIPEKAEISIEKKHFQILFSNLITNAIRYNKLNGDIHISLRWRKLTIRDTWIGMSGDEAKRIFERFYRVDRSGKIPGTGIGLTIVDRIVRLYGWDIRVESEKWVGTSFIISMK